MTWPKKLPQQWPRELGRWVPQARSRGAVEAPAEHFLVQSVFTDCCETSGGCANDPGTRIRATIGESYRVQSMGSLGLAIHFGWSRGAYTN